MSRSFAALLKRVTAQLSLEDAGPVGIRTRELEYTFYGQVCNLGDLEKNSFKKEDQEQWLVPIDTPIKGKARIRMIDGKTYVLTTKIRRTAIKGSEEVECIISQDMYNSLKEMGTGGYRKTRYIFQVPNSTLVWEIDVFKNALGEDCDWVKIDLEVPDESTPIPELPLPFIQVITHQPKDYDATEKGIVDNLWDNVWVSMDADQKVGG